MIPKSLWSRLGAVLLSGAMLLGLAVAPANADDIYGKMYWSDFDDQAIYRADLDGFNVEELLTGVGCYGGLALDPAGGKMYWTQTDFSSGSIQRANLDGSGIEELVSGLAAPIGLALEPGAGQMYWTDFITNSIQRAN
ncbi:unnamed protein product, partial [marine sediment metagenome]